MKSNFGIKSTPDYFGEKALAKAYNLTLERLMSILVLIITGLGILLGCLSLSLNSLDSYSIPLLIIIGICMFIFFTYIHYGRTKEWKLLAFSGAAFLSAYILSILPEYLYGFHVSAIIHHSFVSALLLLAVSIPSFCHSMYYSLGATPKARDFSRYPVILLPIVLMLIAYGILVFRLFVSGIPHINWHILTTPYEWQDWQTITWQNGWPTWAPQQLHQTGISNFILGTLLLMLMTIIISLPIGIGVGIYITEYSSGWLANIIKTSCTVLRSISVFILGLTAITIVRLTQHNFFSYIFAGYFYDATGNIHIANGSFVTAALVISLLVIPIIARATEEGIRSSPREMAEGSYALGASKWYTVANILIPWSLPNIITGILLGCAEATGSLATIWFISGTGQYGIGPFNQVTTLSYFIFYARGDIDMNFHKVEGIYQYSAAVILIVITVVLSIAVVLLKRRLNKRLKGT
jgi:ABC-type phosphate transport system permease subunit